MKKEVDFVPHTPPKVKSKNVAGPPVYYPPGAAEFTKKEECSAAMSQAGVSIFSRIIFSCYYDVKYILRLNILMMNNSGSNF